MPFRSEAQRKYLEANLPDVAKKFAADTKPDATLPARVEPRARPSRPAKGGPSPIQQIAARLVNRPG